MLEISPPWHGSFLPLEGISYYTLECSNPIILKCPAQPAVLTAELPLQPLVLFFKTAFHYLCMLYISYTPEVEKNFSDKDVSKVEKI